MGQYYKIINTTKKEVLVPWSYDCGAKLMEHSYMGDDGKGNILTGAFIQLLTNEWKGDCVVLCGDYADEEYMTNNFPELWKDLVEQNPWLRKRREYDGKYYDRSLYECDDEEYYLSDNTGYTDLYDIKQTDKCPRYALNFDKHEYVDLYNPSLKAWDYTDEETGEKRTVLIFALNLLLAVGNGLGGGDYSGEDEQLVGHWAGDSIGLEDEIPDGFTELSVGFTED